MIWIIGLLAVGGLALFLNSEIGRILSGRWSFTKSVEEDRGRFLWLVLDFDYRGEPQHCADHAL